MAGSIKETTNRITEIAGYFSLLTDKLVFDFEDEDKKKKAWHKFNKTASAVIY
jgi:hypothetical protein